MKCTNDPPMAAESGRVSDIIKSKKLYGDLVEFHWRYYSELAFQRKSIREELNSSLRNAAAAFQFSGWQRVVKYKYSLDPLSAKGSLFDQGGRFNVGAIDSTRHPMFPALYLAVDKGTALAEGDLGETRTWDRLRRNNWH